MKKLIRIILALAIGSTLIGCSSKPGGTIDLTSNIKVSIRGFNGKGEVYIDNNTKYDKTNSDIRDFVADIEYTLENGANGTLSNGDEITIKAKYSKSKAKDLGLTIKNPTKKVKVSGLKDLLTGYYDCEIKVKNYGLIKLKLDANPAPITSSLLCSVITSAGTAVCCMFCANAGLSDVTRSAALNTAAAAFLIHFFI